MKKFILLALAALVMVGCEDTSISYTTSDGTIVEVIDSCEYIMQHTYMYDIHTHKGNCRFCKERRQKEMKELIEQIKGK
jgi:hypothetical protein